VCKSRSCTGAQRAQEHISTLAGDRVHDNYQPLGSTWQLGWAWQFLRPYRREVAALVALSLAEIALRVLAPWALVIVIDHALGAVPLTGRVARVVSVSDSAT